MIYLVIYLLFVLIYLPPLFCRKKNFGRKCYDLPFLGGAILMIYLNVLVYQHPQRPFGYNLPPRSPCRTGNIWGDRN